MNTRFPSLIIGYYTIEKHVIERQTKLSTLLFLWPTLALLVLIHYNCGNIGLLILSFALAA